MEAQHEATLRERVEELGRALADLQRRVTLLERNETAQAAAPAREIRQPELELPELGLPEAPSDESIGGVVPLLGWGLLGIAGAYLLRAATESGYLHGLLAAGIGIFYAAAWLFMAARKAHDRPLVSIIHGLTAALVIAPMLYEMTVTFHLLPGSVSSAVAVCFSVFGLAIGWKRSLTPVAWISTLAGLATATALFRETHEATVWAVSILAVAAAVEFAASRDHWLGLRWIVALAANFSLLLVTLATSLAPPTGVLLALQLALLTIYLSSTIDRTLLRGLNITGFEIAQTAIAFVIAIGGALRMTDAAQSGHWAVGAFCLTAGAVCYFVSFATLENKDGKSRNFYTYSTFALLLLIAACRVLLAGAPLVAAFAGLAVAALAAEFLKDRYALRLHAGAYLLLAVGISEMVQRATERIIRTGAGVEGTVSAGFAFALLGAALCYLALAVQERKQVLHWTDTVETTLVAALAAWGALGAAAGWMSAAPLRTALLTAAALAMGWSGRREWRRLAYPLMGLAGIKLLAEDLQQGRSWTLFGSLILFGGGLILLPRLMRRGAPSAQPARAQAAASSAG